MSFGLNLSSQGGEKTSMGRLIKIEGKAAKVFSIIKTICQRNPHMTLEEAGKKGLLDPDLQRTVPYIAGKFPEVNLNSGIENN
jgi:hypothetical protein